MLKEQFSRHFLVVHTFVSDEARKAYLTPPEKRNPPEERQTEHQWAIDAAGEFAQCMQQLNAFELEGKVVSSMVSEMFQFMSAYRDSDQILQQYPEEGDKW